MTVLVQRLVIVATRIAISGVIVSLDLLLAKFQFLGRRSEPPFEGTSRFRQFVGELLRRSINQTGRQPASRSIGTLSRDLPPIWVQ